MSAVDTVKEEGLYIPQRVSQRYYWNTGPGYEDMRAAKGSVLPSAVFGRLVAKKHRAMVPGHYASYPSFCDAMQDLSQALHSLEEEAQQAQQKPTWLERIKSAFNF